MPCCPLLTVCTDDQQLLRSSKATDDNDADDDDADDNDTQDDQSVEVSSSGEPVTDSEESLSRVCSQLSHSGYYPG